MYVLKKVFRRNPPKLLAYHFAQDGSPLPEFIKTTHEPVAFDCQGLRPAGTHYVQNDVTGDLWVPDKGDWIILQDGEPVDVIGNDYFAIHYGMEQISRDAGPVWVKDVSEVDWSR